MLFNSLEFLMFFPIVVLLYFIIPNKVRYIWLLVASYYFYMCWNAKYALLILASTAVTYFGGILIDRLNNSGKRKEKKNKENKKSGNKKKIIVAICCVINFGILFFFKYFDFAMDIIARAFMKFNVELNVPDFDIILPVGISFFTFQAVGYLIDVYRGQIKAEKNFLKYALFVSFFPQLVAGPIERSRNLLTALSKPQKFDFDRARDGLLSMLWGFFLKIVIADRIAIFVDTVYGDSGNYSGAFLVIASILFAFQIYCDFSGYSNIAIGSARILGIELMENFDAPYLSTSVAVFWRRWHISLTSWFKDYLYIPLGGSRKGKIRKYLNQLLVFTTSGLWHGANLSFILWGALNGFYQVIGEITKPVRDRLVRLLQLNRESMGHKLLQITTTFVLIDFSWIFFRAKSIRAGFDVIKSIFTTWNPWVLFDGSLYECGLDEKNFNLLIICLLILIFADICRRRRIKIREILMKQDYWFRWIFIALVVTAILVFGKYGPAYDAANFIYFQF